MRVSHLGERYKIYRVAVVFTVLCLAVMLSVGCESREQLTSGALQDKNDFGSIGYGGPCPPPGRAHRYQFTLYALDQPLDLEAEASKKQVIEAMPGHILAQGQLTGTYQR